MTHAAEPSVVPVAVVAKLRALIEAREPIYWGKRSTVAGRRNYALGLVAGLVSGDSVNPFEGKRLSNFQRGRNDPKRAWDTGFLAGQRIRTLLTEPERAYPAILWKEYKELPPELRARVERERPNIDAAHFEG